MRGHLGASLTMGIGSIISLSLKQKLNTKSSTEAELVGIHDAMNFVVWTKIFINWQTSNYLEDSPTKFLGHKNVILQDNTRAIQLEQYRKRSNTKQTRHINIIYFNKISKVYDQMVTAITYCPTKEIMTNYLSKPLQGSLFRIHQNSIMGSMSRMNMNCTTCI